MTKLLSKTYLRNCWTDSSKVGKMVQSCERLISRFPDFHSFYLFYSQYMKINVQRFSSQKIFDILSLIIGFVRFYELFMVICGYICATRNLCDQEFVRAERRLPYIVQEINQNPVASSIQKNKQNTFLEIDIC